MVFSAVQCSAVPACSLWPPHSTLEREWNEQFMSGLSYIPTYILCFTFISKSKGNYVIVMYYCWWFDQTQTAHLFLDIFLSQNYSSLGVRLHCKPAGLSLLWILDTSDCRTEYIQIWIDHIHFRYNWTTGCFSQEKSGFDLANYPSEWRSGRWGTWHRE